MEQVSSICFVDDSVLNMNCFEAGYETKSRILNTLFRQERETFKLFIFLEYQERNVLFCS